MTYGQQSYNLEQRFAGVSDPSEMGTTGLAAWVITGPGGLSRDYARVTKAAAIMRRRGLSVERFSRAVLADVYNRWHHERISRQFAAILKRYPQ